MTSSLEPLQHATLAGTAGAGSVDLLLAQLGDPEHLLLRCAWCGRMEIACVWVAVPVDQWTLRLLQERTTHGICPDCLARELDAAAAARARSRPANDTTTAYRAS